MNFAKFPGTPLLQNTSGRLLLNLHKIPPHVIIKTLQFEKEDESFPFQRLTNTTFPAF